MSWLRRIFGGDHEARRAHARHAGPVYGHGDVPLEPAKTQLLALLRERGARSAVIVYEAATTRAG